LRAGTLTPSTRAVAALAPACRALLAELTVFVKANHPYDEPEVVALPIQGGSLSYLAWLMKSTKEGN
jgi:uncharacterized protein involved in tolerance to divalent cations